MALSKEYPNYKTFPDIYTDDTENNPCVFSPNAVYAIFFFQTKDSLFVDTDTFGAFLKNAIRQFRNSKVYKDYKSYLFDLGFNSCQIMGNIDTSMVDSKGIEMHHNGITIFDIALMICHHRLAIHSKVSTFNIIYELRHAHTLNHVPIVMLCKTMHQMIHHNDDFFVPMCMTFGFWTELLNDYKYGITYDIAKKLYFWIKISLEHSNNENLNRQLIDLRENIERWSNFNEYRMGNNRYNAANPGTRFDRVDTIPLIHEKNNQNSGDLQEIIRDF